MNECCSLSPHILRANPQIQTFDAVFARARRRSPLRAVPPASS